METPPDQGRSLSSVDRRVLRAVTSSFVLDLYAWTTYRRSRLRRPVLIPWETLEGQLGCQERAVRNFRLAVRRGLEVVRAFYPGLRLEVALEGLWLWPGASHVKAAGGHDGPRSHRSQEHQTRAPGIASGIAPRYAGGDDDSRNTA